MRSEFLECSRRDWLLAAFTCALHSRVNGRELSGFYYRDYSRCLPDYLASLARQAYEKRSSELAKLTTAAAIHQRQRWVRETFWKLIGGEPRRTPLNARATGEFERTGYSVKKVIYESRPGVVVSANLYIPSAGTPPYPAVLFQMGHSNSGKAYGSYQKCCQGLARLGYVVLAFDPMGQGERIAYPDASGTNTRLGSATAEHDLPGKQLLLLGDSSSRYQVWDAIRSLDYLAAHELVDPTRIASTGQSGGGTLTMLLACADDRIAAAAVSSGNTEDVACASFNAPGSTDDAEQDFIGSGMVGFDRWDLLYPIAPKPLLVEVSAHDFFGTYSPRYLQDGREQYEWLAKTYGVLGDSEKLAWRSTPLPHGLTYSLRLGIYNWFERWLKNSEHVIEEEPAVEPELDRTLWVGPTGNVARDFASLRPIDLIRRAASSVRPTGIASDWSRVLPFTPPPGNRELTLLTSVALDGARVSAAEVNTEAQVWVPAWVFAPTALEIRSLLVVLDDRGRNAHAHEDDVYHQLARKGHLVCAVDVRGIGDMRPEVGRGNPDYTIPHDTEEEFAWSSLIFGSPLLSQRITDILGLIRAVRNMHPANSISLALAARGRLTVPALFAFAETQEASSLYLAGGLVSFRSVLETEIYEQPLSNFAWDLFRITDLPLLAAHCVPRTIHLAGAIDAAGKPVPLTELRRIYSSTNIRFSPQPAWDEGALSSV